MEQSDTGVQNKRKDTYIYPAVFYFREDEIAVFFPDLPGCNAEARTEEEAYYNAKNVLRNWILTAENSGRAIPSPRNLGQIILTEKEKASLIEVCLIPYRKAFNSRAVKKTLTIPLWLNELAEKEKINFSFVLQQALKEQLNVDHNL